MMRRTSAYIHSSTGMPAPPRDMLAAGIDIIPDKKNNEGAKREKRGECRTCGVQTHKIQLFGKRIPLTVEGVVRNGHCLVCHPLEGYIRRPPNNVYSNPNQQHYGGGPPHPPHPHPPHPHPPQHLSPQQPPHQTPHQTNVMMSEVPQPHFLRGQTDIVQPTHRSQPPRNSLPQHLMMQHHHQLMQEEPQHFPEADSGIRVPRTLEVHRMDDDVSVITMDYRLAQAARNWTPGGMVEVTYNSDEETDVQPPAPSRRPGPDNGDTFSNQEPVVARAPSSRGLPGHRSSHRDLGGGNRRMQANPLPPTQEDSPEIAMNFHYGTDSKHYRGGYPLQEQKHDYTGRSQRQGFDADGYPMASTAYGWDKQADLLPPGGTDMLFHNRSGEMDSPLPTHRRQTSAPHEEIRFKPSGISPREHPPATLQTDTSVPVKRRQDSLESGPMFLPDDLPTLDDNDSPSSPKQTRLRMQVSQPAFNAGIGIDYQRYNGAEDAMPVAPSGLRTAKTLGALNAQYPYRDSESYSQPFNGRSAASIAVGQREEDEYPGKIFDSRRSGDDGASHSTTSSVGRPLVSRDLRGRPDDDSIHEPSVTINSSYPNHPLMGTLLDDGNDDDSPMNWQIALAAQARSGDGVQTSKKAAPEQYAPELSPIGLARRVGAQDGILDTEVEGRNVSSELAYMNDSNERRVPQQLIPHAPTLQNNNASSEHLATVSASSKVPPPENHAYPTMTSTKTAFSPTLITETIRKLSITPTEERTESPQSRPGAHAVGGQEQTVHDIPVIIHCLGLTQTDAIFKENALRTLAAILWKSGGRGRNLVVEFKGIDTLVKTMWDDMSNAAIQDAAAELLLAVAASPDAKPSNDILANEDAFCDSLLFAMQAHANVPSIQLKGCAIFSCLAAASANNSSVSDGSLSGASTMVLTAMNNHGRSIEIQKAGLQALYYQCTLSRDAETNKRNLVKSQLDNGSSGLDVILDTIKSPLQNDHVAMEWACRLCWSLTSSEDMVNKISGVAVMVEDIAEICHVNISNTQSKSLLEACFGVMGNLAHVEANRMELFRCGAVTILMEGMRNNRNDYQVALEACSALANLSLAHPIRDGVINGGGIATILHALHTHIDSDEFVGEALRALVCLVVNSEEGKEKMSGPDVIKLVIAAGYKHQTSGVVQELCCKLLASLAVRHGTSEIIVEDGGGDVIRTALQSHSDERVHDAACSAYRNLACQIQDTDPLIQQVSLKHVINSMSSHEGSVSIQSNACCALWNIAYKTNVQPGALVGCQGVQAIVKAMQNHMESSELLELACGALWSIVDESIDRKKDVVGSGAIDAVICALVMHPTSKSTLIKASGVFSNISAEGPLAEAVANAQGVSVVCDAMCNNGSAIAFLETCCLTLRNIVFHLPEYAEEASMIISTIIEAMREHITAASFQKEACYLLWILAAAAKPCQSKILALDGMSVLRECMEQNSHDPKVQEAVVGAIKQVAVNGYQ